MVAMSKGKLLMNSTTNAETCTRVIDDVTANGLAQKSSSLKWGPSKNGGRVIATLTEVMRLPIQHVASFSSHINTLND